MSGKLVSWARARAKVDLPAPGEPMTSTSSISLAPSRNTHPQKTKRRPPCEDRRLFVSAKAASGGLLLGRRFFAVGGFSFVFGGLLGRGHVTGRSLGAFGLLERRRCNQRRDREIAVGNGVEGDVLGERTDLLAADFDHDDRVHEVAGAELAHQLLGFDVDRSGFFLAAVDNGGNTAFAAQYTGGSLASPFARLGRQGQSIAHGIAFRMRLISGPPRLQG